MSQGSTERSARKVVGRFQTLESKRCDGVQRGLEWASNGVDLERHKSLRASSLYRQSLVLKPRSKRFQEVFNE
jgi:hypothetical protein